jgi:hypothetical protein
MARAARRGTLAVVIAAALLAAGAVIAVVFTDALPPSEGGGDRDPIIAWAARVLLALAALWVLIGMLAARTSLVRRPGAAGARAAWLASTRPWRARESTLGLLAPDRWLLLIVPGGLLVATRAVQTRELGWGHLLLALAGWLGFAVVARLLLWRRSPWPIIAAVGGVVVLRCILSLAAFALTGSDEWAFAGRPVLRACFLALALAAFAWTFVAAGWALSAQFGGRRATGIVLASTGAAVLLPAATVALIGERAAVAAWIDYLGLAPWRVSAALGLPASGEIAIEVAWGASAVGAVVLVAGILVARPGRAPQHATLG